VQQPDPVGDIYSAIGAEQPFYMLVEEFYKGVETDQVLRPLYPPDLSDAKKHLAMFLIQRTGGKQTYSELRGHPRMRGRHMPFAIGFIERNAWLHHMSNALNAVPEFANHKGALNEFFESFATFLINQPN
jgi:hemoglobin